VTPQVPQSGTCKGVSLLQLVVGRWKWCFDIDETTMPLLGSISGMEPSVVVVVLSDGCVVVGG
jgi:hypothetical protein